MMKIETTIGISLGTRFAGIAVFRGTELLAWQILSFRGTWSPQKKVHIIKRLMSIINRYEVQAVALKVPPPPHISLPLQQLKKSFKLKMKESNIPIKECTINQLKALCLPDGKGNKKELGEHAVKKYPELKRIYNRQKESKNGYYLKIFEAIISDIHYSLWRLKNKT